MTVHVLAAGPLHQGLALPDLVSDDPTDGGVPGLDKAGATTLAGAMLRDAAVSASSSGGDLLVNHPTEAQLPAERQTGVDPAAELRELLEPVLDDLEAVRFEPQVGGTFEARVGNALAHLLREEDADSVAVLDGRAPTLDRTALDSAAMKLRRSEAVVGPAPGGRVAYLGLTASLDFAGAWQPPALRSLVDRAVDAGHAVDFLPMQPRVDGPDGLATVVAHVEARRTAGRRVPGHTATAIDQLGLQVSEEAGSLRVRAGTTDRA